MTGGNTTARVSIVIPMFNEEDNVLPMLERLHQALETLSYPWEAILVNDGSSDATGTRMRDAQEQYGDHIRIINLQRNFGQTAALQAGLDQARGDIIVTMDGDLQNDPKDIPRMVGRLVNESLDLVAGWRASRKDNLLIRKIPSQIANRLIGKITGVRIHDYGCTLKVYRADVIKDVRLYGEMHRFIPAWAAAITDPARIKEEIVNHHARQHGKSKYTLARTFRVILDLLSVYFLMRYKSRPGHFFGSIGLLFGAVGALALFYLFFLKIFLGQDIGTRPLLIVGVLLVVVSVQFLTTGVLSELIARTYYESSNSKAYVIHRDSGAAATRPAAWKTAP